MWWAVHLGWCRLLGPWVRHHTGGWLVWSDHSISGVWGGLSATGTLFSGSRCWCSCPMWSSSPSWGGPVGAQCLSWGGEQMSGGNSLLLGMIAALASSGVVSSRRCLGSFPDLGSILLQRTLCQKNIMDSCFMAHFLLLKTSPSFWAMLNRLMFASWSLSFFL